MDWFFFVSLSPCVCVCVCVSVANRKHWKQCNESKSILVEWPCKLQIIPHFYLFQASHANEQNVWTVVIPYHIHLYRGYLCCVALRCFAVMYDACSVYCKFWFPAIAAIFAHCLTSARDSLDFETTMLINFKNKNGKKKSLLWHELKHDILYMIRLELCGSFPHPDGWNTWKDNERTEWNETKRNLCWYRK